MAKVYLQGKYGLGVLKERVGDSVYKKMMKIDGLSEMYLETEDGKLSASKGIYQIKVTSGWGVIEKFMGEMSGLGFKMINLKSGTTVDYQVGSKKIRFYSSGGRLANVVDENGNSKGSKQPKTAEQEDGVVWSLRNGGFDAKYVSEKVGFQFDASWNTSFETTYRLISSKIRVGNYEIWRDSDKKKPKWLSEITDDKYLPDKKGNWNPADIWMVKKGYSGSDLVKVFNEMKQGKRTVYELNEKIMEHFDSGKLVGVSLKKVGKTGTFKKVVADMDLIGKMKYKGVSKKQSMSVNNSYLDLYVDIHDGVNDIDYLIRFRPRGKSGSLNVYFEGKPVSRSTWDGAVSKDMLNKKYFKGKIDDMVKEVDKMDASTHSVLSLAEVVEPGIVKFLKQSQSRFVRIVDYEDHSQNDYITKRGFVLVLWLYHLEQHDPKEIIRDSFISSMKLNDFSSVHYKVS